MKIRAKAKKGHNVVSLEISSGRGLAVGAEHYHAMFVFYDPDDEYHRIELKRTLTAKEAKVLNKKDDGNGYRAGSTTERFDSEEDIIELAIETFQQVAPHATILVLGSSAVLEPQMILVGPDDFKKRVNELAERRDKLEWDTDEEELEQICDEWEALNKKYGVVR